MKVGANTRITIATACVAFGMILPGAVACVSAEESIRPLHVRLPSDRLAVNGSTTAADRVFAEPTQSTSPATAKNLREPIDGTASKDSATPPGRGFPALITDSGEDGAESLGKRGLGDGSFVTGPMLTTVCALLVVLSVFGIYVWLSKRYGAAESGRGTIPDDVLQNLGTLVMDAKMQLSVIRCGDRILLVSRNAAGDAQTLTEITDTEQVERITNRCLGRPQIVGRRSVVPVATDLAI